MNGQVIRLLERDQAKRIEQKLNLSRFVDGRITAVNQAAAVKHNLQAARNTGETSEIDEIVTAAINKNNDLRLLVLPTKFVTPIYSRYEPGMKYGDHVDSALMGNDFGCRTDLAMTVFLSSPSSYDGGELVIPGAGRIKLDVGEAYIYPATSIHRVQPVTRGVRLAVVTWFQSAVRDETLRGILFDLARGVQAADAMKDFEHQLLLSKCYHNLIRYAAEPH